MTRRGCPFQGLLQGSSARANFSLAISAQHRRHGKDKAAPQNEYSLASASAGLVPCRPEIRTLSVGFKD